MFFFDLQEILRIQNNLDFALNEHCIIQQCTGLKNKKGHLIYEGDIVNWQEAEGGILPPSSKQPYKCKIIWGDWQQEAFNCRSFDEKSCFMFNPSFMEIIGNIYEGE